VSGTLAAAGEASARSAPATSAARLDGRLKMETRVMDET